MTVNSNTEQQLSQEESREPYAVETVVQTVNTQPDPPDPEAGPPEDPGETGTETKVDPGTFKVMQGRKSEHPARDRVKALMEAISRGVILPLVIVYEDISSGERFSPDGAHRRAAYKHLKQPIPIRLIRVYNAQARAEEESCGANTGNSRSRSDQKFQLAKAHEIYKKKFGKDPKPSDLAKMTGVNHTTCTAFLREALAPKQKDAPEVEEDESQQAVVAALQEAYKILQAIDIEDDWVAGSSVQGALTEIAEEVKRIKQHKQRYAVVTSEEVKRFMGKHKLTMEQMGKMIGVRHATVSRWLSGKTKITPHHQRTISQVMSLKPDKVAIIMEPDDE